MEHGGPLPRPTLPDPLSRGDGGDDHRPPGRRRGTLDGHGVPTDTGWFVIPVARGPLPDRKRRFGSRSQSEHSGSRLRGRRVDPLPLVSGPVTFLSDCGCLRDPRPRSRGVCTSLWARVLGSHTDLPRSTEEVSGGSGGSRPYEHSVSGPPKVCCPCSYRYT